MKGKVHTPSKACNSVNYFEADFHYDQAAVTEAKTDEGMSLSIDLGAFHKFMG